MNSFEGKLRAEGKKFGIVIGRFNVYIGRELLAGAKDCLCRHGAREEDISVAWVPGSFEIPMVAQAMASSRKYDAVICLGVLIRGQTPHFDYIAAEATKGIAHVGLTTGVPTSYGVITADTLEQAIERAGTKAGNKGWDAALAAIEMADLLTQLS
ncbi:MAG: 6,7-dimethyl-8-ribityllumazine synthase [bacterium]